MDYLQQLVFLSYFCSVKKKKNVNLLGEMQY